MCSCGRLETKLWNVSHLPAPGCVEGAMHHQQRGPCGCGRTLHCSVTPYLHKERDVVVPASTAAGSEQTERQCTCDDGGMCSISSSRPSRSSCLVASACLRRVQSMALWAGQGTASGQKDSHQEEHRGTLSLISAHALVLQCLRLLDSSSTGRWSGHVHCRPCMRSDLR